MSNYIIVNGELYHHGVKGMKWGMRKKRMKGKEARPILRKENELNRKIEDAKVKADIAYRENSYIYRGKMRVDGPEYNRARAEVRKYKKELNQLMQTTTYKEAKEWQKNAGKRSLGVVAATGALTVMGGLGLVALAELT